MSSKNIPEDKTWLVYLLRCRDHSIYTGITNNIKRRLQAHNKGAASKYTRGRLPVKLLAISGRMNQTKAMRLELNIKKLPKEKKRGALRQTGKI